MPAYTSAFVSFLAHAWLHVWFYWTTLCAALCCAKQPYRSQADYSLNQSVHIYIIRAIRPISIRLIYLLASALFQFQLGLVLWLVNRLARSVINHLYLVFKIKLWCTRSYQSLRYVHHIKTATNPEIQTRSWFQQRKTALMNSH